MRDLFGHLPAPSQSTKDRQRARLSAIRAGDAKAAKTRAELIGCKPRVLAARARRKVATIRAVATGIGMAWEDIDNSMLAAGEELEVALSAFEAALEDSIVFVEESGSSMKR